MKSNQRELDVAVSALEETLRTQADGYQRLLVALERKREAIKNAELDRVPGIAEVEREILNRLEQLDQRREERVAALAGLIGLPVKEISVSRICEELDAEAAARVSGLARILRERLERSRKESSVIRVAGEALARHMAGVVQSVTGALAGARIYGSRGKISNGVALVRGLDVSS